jgi:DNA-binding CsgD family transcriptional regulator
MDLPIPLIGALLGSANTTIVVSVMGTKTNSIRIDVNQCIGKSGPVMPARPIRTPSVAVLHTGQVRNRDKREEWHSYKLPKDSLTPRELEVCRFLVEGLALKEIAYRSNISISTVDHHTRNLYRKLGVHSRVELFRRFAGEPLIEVRESPRTSDSVHIIQKLASLEEKLDGILDNLLPRIAILELRKGPTHTPSSGLFGEARRRVERKKCAPS